MRLDDIVIVLSRPAESGNVGAACRAMKNMGVTKLRLAAPLVDDEETLIARAVHAAQIWEKREVFDTLDAAIADSSIVIGTTRRRGHKRKSLSLTPRELAAYLAGRGGKAALVFGNERTGLTTEELSLCTLSSHIPVDSEFPSLNLSHAVQIYCYELRAALFDGDAPLNKGHWHPITEREKIDALSTSACDVLEKIGFFKTRGREEKLVFFRDILSRAGLTETEWKYMHDIIAKAGSLLSEGRGTGFGDGNLT